MIDGCGRSIDRVRLSLTDHCNLACRYCVPAGTVATGSTMLDADFAFELIRWLAERHGVRFVRLTGGEPLFHPELVPLIERLAGIGSLDEISLTTNAQALAAKARALADAGLARVNVSLDTLDPGQFNRMTRGGHIERTLRGIKAAIDAGLTPVKINVVVQRGFNDDQISRIAEWGLALGCVVRFLEVMPLGPMTHVVHRHLVPASDIRERLATRFDLKPIRGIEGQPAEDYAATGARVRGVIGIVAPTTRPFCDRCRRLRITSSGWLVPCLHDVSRFDLRTCWDGTRLDVNAADTLLRKAILEKPLVGPRTQSVTMLSLGG